jgi:hypothetical protein
VTGTYHETHTTMNHEAMRRRPKGWETDKLGRWHRKLVHRKRRRTRRRDLAKLATEK